MDIMLDLIAVLGIIIILAIAWHGAHRPALRQDEWDTALVELWEKGE